MRESFLTFGSPVTGEAEIAEVVDSDDLVEALTAVLRR
jgi:hypothetical protein